MQELPRPFLGLSVAVFCLRPHITPLYAYPPLCPRFPFIQGWHSNLISAHPKDLVLTGLL